MAASLLLPGNPSLTPATPKSGPPRPYDFSSPDRIPAAQLRLLEPVNRNFAQSLALNISAYLRTLVEVSITQAEQLSFGEFSRKIGPPLTVIPLTLHPHDGTAVLQLSHAAVFPVIEMLLGGTARPAPSIDREITEIERCVFEPALRILVQELRSSWRVLGAIEFGTLEPATAVPLLSSIPPAEPFFGVSLELRIGEIVGGLNLGVPSRVLRPLLNEMQPRRASQTEDCSKMLRLLERAAVTAGVRMNGAKVLFRDLMNLEPGDVLAFDHAVGKELDLELNGTPKFKGHVVAVGENRGFQLKRECRRES